VRQRDAPRLAAASSTFVQADRHRTHREGQADHYVPDEQRGEADVVAQTGVLKELQQSHAGDQRGQHQRAQRQRDHCLAPAEAVTREREGER
jgi:hypothetical protein